MVHIFPAFADSSPHSQLYYFSAHLRSLITSLKLHMQKEEKWNLGAQI